MTQNEIIEGNKLIAEFMGGRFYKSDPMFLNGSTPCYYFADESKTVASHTLKYHSSWDWLMPVVEKIGLTHGYEIMPKTCYIFNANGSYIHNEDNETKIAVWLAVVEFIKWYNQNH